MAASRTNGCQTQATGAPHWTVPGVKPRVAALAWLAVIAIAGCSPTPTATPTVQESTATPPPAIPRVPQVPMPGTPETAVADAACTAIVTGRLSEADAARYANTNGLEVRVGERDGEYFMLTMDFNPSRVTLAVENDIVTRCTTG